jgi:hypothetical protein
MATPQAREPSKAKRGRNNISVEIVLPHWLKMQRLPEPNHTVKTGPKIMTHGLTEVGARE